MKKMQKSLTIEDKKKLAKGKPEKVAIVFHAKPALRKRLLIAAKKNDLSLSALLREIVVGKRPALS